MEMIDWKKFNRWESEYLLKKWGNALFSDALQVAEELYAFALSRSPEMVQPPWPGDEAAKELPHLRALIEMGRKMRGSS